MTCVEMYLEPHMGKKYWNGLVMSVVVWERVWLHIWLVWPMLLLLSSKVFRQDLILLLHLLQVPTFKIDLFCPSPVVISQLPWLL